MEEGQPKKKTGRRSLEEVNRIRREAGLPTYGEEKIVKEVKVVEKPVVVYKDRVVKEVVVKRKVGRPKKQPIVANSDKAKQQLFLAELLHGKAEKVIKKVIEKALNDEDKDQMACMKLCVERILPVSYFDKAKETGSKGVNITIMGVGMGETVISDSTASMELTEDDYEEVVVDET